MNDDAQFSDDELKRAFEAHEPEMSDSHFDRLRKRLSEHTHPARLPGEEFEIILSSDSSIPADSAVPTASARPMRMRVPRQILLLRGAAMALALMLAFVVVRPFMGTATANLSSAFDATRTASWVHATTQIKFSGETRTMESWCSPQKRIVAFRSPDRLHVIDYAAGVQTRYLESHRAIYRWRADMSSEHFGRDFLGALLSYGDVQSAFPFHHVGPVETRTIKQNRKTRLQYEFELTLKKDPTVRSHTIIEVDRTNRRLVSWQDRHANGTFVVTRFDYPSSGPENIYELGVASNMRVVDRVASSDIVEMSEQFKTEINQFDDYQALVIDRIETEDPQRETEVLIRRLQRSGASYQVDWLTPIDPQLTIPDTPTLQWWHEHRDEFHETPLAICNGTSCTTYPVADEQLEIVNDMGPRRWKVHTFPVVPIQTTVGETTVPVWPSLWPEYACRPLLKTTSPQLRYELDPSGAEGPPGSMRLRLVKGSGPFAREWSSYWLSETYDRCVVKSVFARPRFFEMDSVQSDHQLTSAFRDFQQSPSGTFFATHRTQRASGQTTTRVTWFLVDFESP